MYRLYNIVLMTALAAQTLGQTCTIDSTREQFRQYVARLRDCSYTIDGTQMSIFQAFAPIYDHLYDELTDAFVGEIGIEQIQELCSQLDVCKKSILGSKDCDQDMMSHIRSLGTSLCGDNGVPALNKAVKILKSDGCNEDEVPENAPQPDGCHNQIPIPNDVTYLEWIKEQRKRWSSLNQCLARWRSQHQCSTSSSNALAVIADATQNFEILGETLFDTDYKPVEIVDGKQYDLYMYGLNHLETFESNVSQTCQADGDVVLLFNTYMVIDGTNMRLLPGSEGPSYLSHVTVTLRDIDGTTLDAYTASASDPLQTTFSGSQRSSSQTNSANANIRQGGDNSVVITHSASSTSLVIVQVENRLQLIVQAPENLLESESVGWLISGCPESNSVSKTVQNSDRHGQCESNCASFGPRSSSCVYDCVMDKSFKVNAYSQIDEEYERLNNILTSTAPSLPSTTLVVVLTVVLSVLKL